MSISSCPRCGKHVTLPVGVSDQVRVKCPLCEAEYSLSEALANSPPLLLVMDDAVGSEPWQPPFPATEAPEIPLEFQTESDEYAGASVSLDDGPLEVAPLGQELLGDEPVTGELDGLDDLSDLGAAPPAPAAQLEQDDFSLQEQDTEVEDLSFSRESLASDAANDFEPLLEEASGEFEPLDVGGPDAPGEFDLVAPADDEEVSFGEPELSGTRGDDEMLDFGEPEPLATLDNSEGATLDFGEPMDPDATIDFQPGDLAQSAADADDLVPDFGEPEAAPAMAFAAAEAPEEPTGKKKKEKKKKEKKEKPPKAPKAEGEPRKRSLVGTLVTSIVSMLIVVPLVLYGLLWLGPDFDFLNIGRKLPTAMVPAAFKPKPMAQMTPAGAAAFDGMVKAATDAVARATENQAAQNAPAPGEPAADGTGEPAAGPAADQVAETPATPATPEPAEPAAEADKVAEAEPAAAPPATDGADAKSELAESEPAPSATEEMPDEKPATAAAEPSDDIDSLLGSKSDDQPEEKLAAKPVAEPELPAEPAAPAEPAEPVGPVNAPVFAAADMAKATQAVGLATSKMNAAQAAKDDAGLKKARKDFYLSLFGLGQVATFIDDPAERAGLEVVASQLVADAKRLDALKTNSARWFGFAKRTTPGIVLAGNVQGVEEIGKLFQVNVKVGEGAEAPIVPVLCHEDPQLDANDEVITFGSIIEHPEQGLAGYEGSDPTIVWSGVTMKLPAGGK